MKIRLISGATARKLFFEKFSGQRDTWREVLGLEKIFPIFISKRDKKAPLTSSYLSNEVYRSSVAIGDREIRVA